MEGGDFTGETRVPLVEEKCQYQGKGTGGLVIQYVVPLASGKSLEDFVRKAESEAPPQTYWKRICILIRSQSICLFRKMSETYKCLTKRHSSSFSICELSTDHLLKIYMGIYISIWKNMYKYQQKCTQCAPTGSMNSCWILVIAVIMLHNKQPKILV